LMPSVIIPSNQQVRNESIFRAPNFPFQSSVEHPHIPAAYSQLPLLALLIDRYHLPSHYI
jgi:hypothetical protein